MTTMTSVFGMLPLVLMPGSGSELYKGFGRGCCWAVLWCSAVFTLLVWCPWCFSTDAMEVKAGLYTKLLKLAGGGAGANAVDRASPNDRYEPTGLNGL